MPRHIPFMSRYRLGPALMEALFIGRAQVMRDIELKRARVSKDPDIRKTLVRCAKMHHANVMAGHRSLRQLQEAL